MGSYERAIVGFVIFMIMCTASSTIPAPLSTDLSHGFGQQFNWMTLKNACADSLLTGKPIMLIIHQKWCVACRKLMPLFRSSEYIMKLSPFFEMVNVMDEEEPMDAKFRPDGTYYPRILFMSPEGEVQNDICNPEAMTKYLYYYYDAESIAVSMSKCLRRFYDIGGDENEL